MDGCLARRGGSIYSCIVALCYLQWSSPLPAFVSEAHHYPRSTKVSSLNCERRVGLFHGKKLLDLAINFVNKELIFLCCIQINDTPDFLDKAG